MCRYLLYYVDQYYENMNVSQINGILICSTSVLIAILTQWG